MKKTKLKLGYSISLPFNHKHAAKSILRDIMLIKSLSNNFDCLQIMFSKLKLTDDEIKDIQKIVGIYKYIYVHASYQINIGSDLIPLQTEQSNIGIEILIEEIFLATKLKAKCIVLHMGKNVKNKYDSAHIYNNMVKFIVELFQKIKNKNFKIQILLETPTGQGGEMCWNLVDFVDFINLFSKQSFYKKLGICIDTCHIFQADYDLNNTNIIEQVHKIFEPVNNKIKLIHLNDSYNSVGKKIDRHEQIGRGKIKIDKLIKFIYPYKKVPMIIETVGPYEQQIKLLQNNFF